jgi:hypothetical protein
LSDSGGNFRSRRATAISNAQFGIDSKLWSCDLASLTIRDLAAAFASAHDQSKDGRQAVRDELLMS